MTIVQYLQKHLPTEKSIHILDYINSRGCILKITKPRKTKRGDFRQRGNDLTITVNHDENSYRFLFTLVHEIAHLKTFLEYERQVLPHGKEWKSNFKELFYTFKMEEEFGRNSDLLHSVKMELENPKACSGVNISMEKAFAIADNKGVTYLLDIPVGQHFIFKGVQFQKLETRRTRVLCLNVSNKKKYTIHQAAEIELVN